MPEYGFSLTLTFSYKDWVVQENANQKTPRGYDQKRKLFRTNSFVRMHSSAKKVYNEQLTLKSSIQWCHMIECDIFSPCCHNWPACICFCACICLLLRIFCLAYYRLCADRLPVFHRDIGDIVYRTLVKENPYSSIF